MRNNISFNVGTLILTKKIDKEFNFFDSIFGSLKGKTKHLIESVKTFVNNRLDKCVSLSQITQNYQREWFECLGFKEIPKERTLYRDLERIGMKYCFVVEKYQQLLKHKNLIDNKQFVDFSSAYFEGDKAELGELGYSRDSQPGKKQITFGIETGINGVPTGLTIRKGNVQDKKHMKFMLKIVGKVLDKGSLLILDCGGNTEDNKDRIIELGFNYLTLKPKHKETYKRYIQIYKKSSKEMLYVNGIKYRCVKVIPPLLFFNTISAPLVGSRFHMQLTGSTSAFKHLLSSSTFLPAVEMVGLINAWTITTAANAKSTINTLLSSIFTFSFEH